MHYRISQFVADTFLDIVMKFETLESCIDYIEQMVLEASSPEKNIERLNRFLVSPTWDSLVTRNEALTDPSLCIADAGLSSGNFDELCQLHRYEVDAWAQRTLVRLRKQLGEMTTVDDLVKDPYRDQNGWIMTEQPIAQRGRRIVVFCDGTWNTPEELRKIKKYDVMNPPPITNVVRLMRSVVTDDTCTDIPQVVGYFRGVGTDGFVPSRLIDGATGHGLARTVLDAYRFICHNLEWRGPTNPTAINDDEVYIFGFSRGAYAARALNGFLSRFGLIQKNKLWLLPFFFSKYMRMLETGEPLDARTEAIWKDNVHPEYQSIKVKFLGVWDTVGALGLPVKGLSWFTRDYHKFYNTDLTPNVSHAYHALATHEMRRPYRPIFWTNMASSKQVIEQVWFAGAHANVGGGYERTGLSSHALDWMAYKAYLVGLRVDLDYLSSEVLTRSSIEDIAYSRKWGHGEPGFLNQQKVYPSLSRPVETSEIQNYLDNFFDGQTMSADVISSIKAHWSIKERLNVGISYDAEEFSELDKKAQTLPKVDEKETLFLEKKLRSSI